MHVVGLFYEKPWWIERLGMPPPGFIGSGRGLFGMQVGFARKIDVEKLTRTRDRIRHRGSLGFQRASPPPGATD